LIALDQMEASPLTAAQVLAFLNDPDPALRRTGLWIAGRHPDWGSALAQALEARLRAPRFSDGEGTMLGEALSGLGARPEMRAAMASALGDSRLDEERQLIVLGAVARSSWKQWPSEWSPGLGNALRHPSRRVRLEAVGLTRARGVGAADGILTQMAASDAEADEVRIAALSAIGARTPALGDAAFRYLLARLAPKVDAATKLAAAQVLGRAQWTDAQAAEVARNHLRGADPLVLPGLLDVFRNCRSEAIGRELVAALETIEASLGAVGSQRVQEMLSRFPSPVLASAKPLLSRMDAGRRTRLEKLRRLEPVLHGGGDPRRGRDLFFGAKAGCSSCHTIGLEGGHVGPDLTSIGAIRSPHDLLEAIVLPSESFVPGHEVYRVETAREVYSGVLKSRNDEAVLLVTGPGDEVRVPRQDIVKMGYAPVSLMPEGFDEVLDAREMSDLLAFLRAQTSRGAAVQIAGAGGRE
jgi:putative heme-binding domain-containing protein